MFGPLEHPLVDWVSQVLRLAMFVLVSCSLIVVVSKYLIYQMCLDKGCLVRQRGIAVMYCITVVDIFKSINKKHSLSFIFKKSEVHSMIHGKIRYNVYIIYDIIIMFPFLESWVSILAIIGNKVMKEFKSGCVFEVPWHHSSEICSVTTRTRKSCSRCMKIMFIEMLLTMVYSKLLVLDFFD